MPRDLARALGWHAIPAPRAVVSLAAAATGLPLIPAQAQWLHAFSVPMVMSAARARKELRWRPRHSGEETLAVAVAAARERGIVK